jgi:hypothetical protein
MIFFVQDKKSQRTRDCFNARFEAKILARLRERVELDSVTQTSEGLFVFRKKLIYCRFQPNFQIFV